MLKILYQDPAIVVCEKPFRVLSTDEPGGMPTSSIQALGQPGGRGPHRPPADQVVGGLMVYALTPQAARTSPARSGRTVFKGVPGGDPLAALGGGGHLPGPHGPQPQDPKDLRSQTPRQGIQQAVLHYRVVDSRQGSPWCPSGWRPGGPIRSGLSSLPGASLAGDRSTASTPIPRSGRSPCGPTTWPLPTRRPARPWICRLDPPGRGPGRSSPTREGKGRVGPAPVQPPTTCQGQHEAAGPFRWAAQKTPWGAAPAALPTLYHR